jgi:Peptidase family M1 domain
MRNSMTLATQLLGAMWLAVISTPAAYSQGITNHKFAQEDKFRQLEEILPTPNGYRTAAGEPGPEYWQQECDYTIDVTLDDVHQTITGREAITYKNNSPHTLRYLWMQVDPNLFRPDSDSNLTDSPPIADRVSTEAYRALMLRETFDGGATIENVTDEHGSPLKFTVVKTMMRVDLNIPLLPNHEFKFNIAWNYKINNSTLMPGRTGYEYFEKDGNYIYEIAQWFPRMAAYTDATGWQHKQYLGKGEFTLELGDYLVRITVPDDHIVGATGVLQNPNEVLSEANRSRLVEAEAAKTPVFIVTPDEAKENEKEKGTGTKTWVFHAQKVRDFAFASSRKFIWDAQGHEVSGNRVMAMSLYPNEGEPLWSKYSTHAIIHTLNVYSRYTFDYPYPVAYSVNGPVGGMEYPMICFNGPRPHADGTYSADTKYALISVIIHEVGHNYFPMIVNSDERQWTWMDEGINTFLQYLSEQEWETDYPSRRGEPEDIVSYMLSTVQVPVMTNSESLHQFGPNAYAKPATALNILRETILGRELFDYAFKEYARRWEFKRPNPADFFRTMEDASGVDLDWFWRGWFYTTDHCDIAISDVDLFQVDKGDPDAEALRKTESEASQKKTLSEQRNAALTKRADLYPELRDFYNNYDPDEVTEEQRKAYEKFLSELTEDEKKILESKNFFYRVSFKNMGGLVMPVILHLTFEDKSTKEIRIPAEIWRMDSSACSTMLVTEQPVKQFELDPYRETADADRNNNFFPPQITPSRFKVFKSRRETPENAMQRAMKKEKEKADKEKADKEKAEADQAKAEAEKAKEEADKAKAESEKSDTKKDDPK